MPVVAAWPVLQSVPSAHVPLLCKIENVPGIILASPHLLTVALSQHVDPAGKFAPLHILVLVEPGTASQVKGDMQHC